MTELHTLQQQILGDELLTREEVAQLLDLAPLSVTRMVSRGELPCIRYARRVRFRASDVRAWLKARMSYVYHGPTQEEQEMLEIQKTLHDACKCAHVAETLAKLICARTASPTDASSKNEVTAHPSTHPFEELLSLNQSAELLGVSIKTLSRSLARGAVPAIMIGRRRMVRRADLDNWLLGSGASSTA